jgi:hypothetical protein
MHVDAEDVLKLAAAEDQQPVEALAADASDPAFQVGVRVWGPYRCADYLDVLRRKEGVGRRAGTSRRGRG